MFQFLKHPLARNIDLDSPIDSLSHAEIIKSKPFLLNLYEEWSRQIINRLPPDISGPVVEIGSGSGILRELCPDIISSDIVPKKDLAIILDAVELPFQPRSLRAIVMMDVFHHIPDVQSFLLECIRTLKAGGTIIMIEPWLTVWSRLVYRYLHHEPYVPETSTWQFPAKGPLSDANLALPWVVFKRDIHRFQTSFQELKLCEITPDWPFSYLLSGGVSMKCLVPANSYGFFRKLERVRLLRKLSMFAIITIKKAPL